MMRVLQKGLACLILSAIWACGGSSSNDAGDAQDADVLDGGAQDASDAGSRSDAGPVDVGSRDAGPRDIGSRDAGFPPGSTPIRVVAANLTSGNGQDYDQGHGLRILASLSADIVLIQELNYLSNSPTDIRSLVDENFGATFEVIRAATGSLPNGIISRWPIIDSGTWADAEVGNRGFTWARVDIPGPIDLWGVSLHLLTRNGSTRTREAAQLVGYIEANIPATDYLVVGGDLNTNTRNEGALSTLEAVISTRYVPVDREGNDGTNMGRSKPYDWVLPDLDLEAHHIPVVLAGQVFPDGLVFDTRVFTPIEDLYPVLQSDSDAPQMQHMAVLRDFLIPAP